MSIAGQYLVIADAEEELINGESEGSKGKHRHSIDIRSWDWSVADRSSVAERNKKKGGKVAPRHTGPSGTAGSAETGITPELFKFTKGVDSSTTRLMRAMDKNECLRWARFILHEERAKGANDGHADFQLNVTLDDVYVVGYSVQGRAAEARVDIDETWELHYKTITIDYVSQRVSVDFERKAGTERSESDTQELASNSKTDKRITALERQLRAAGSH